MALKATLKETTFGVGDSVRVHQLIREGDKTRVQIFEGMVIGIGGRGSGKSFTVRRIGSQKIGIEKIFPLAAPVLEKVEVVRKGTAGVHQAKLYYTRRKSKRQIERIYSRVSGKDRPQVKPRIKVKSKVKKTSK